MNTFYKIQIIALIAITAGVLIFVYTDQVYAIGTPPIERGYIRNIEIKNSEYDKVTYPLIDYQYEFESDFYNNQDREQDFVWLGQIKNESKQTVYLTWINGTLYPEDGSSVTFSWIPYETGKYTVTSFMWESLDNPSALTPPLKKEFEVFSKLERNQISVDGFVINFKTNNTVIENLWFTPQRNSFDIRVEPNDNASLEIELPFRIFLSEGLSLADLTFAVLNDDVEIPFTSKTKSSSVIFDIPINNNTKFVRIVGFFPL